MTGLNVATLWLLLALCRTGFAETEVQGEVSGVWDADGSPYIVVDSTWIPAEERLTIQPGVTVLFQADQGFYIYGFLIAEGTEEDSIGFTAVDDTTVWKGLYNFGEWLLEQRLNYCWITNCVNFFNMDAQTAINVQHSRINPIRYTTYLAGRNNYALRYITFEHCSISGMGVGTVTGWVTLRNCMIHCDVILIDGRILIEDCEIWGTGPHVFDARVNILRTKYHRPNDSTYVGVVATSDGSIIDSEIDGDIGILGGRGTFQIINTSAWSLNADCDILHIERSRFRQRIFISGYSELQIIDSQMDDYIRIFESPFQSSATITRSVLNSSRNLTSALEVEVFDNNYSRTFEISHNVFRERARFILRNRCSLNWHHNTMVVSDTQRVLTSALEIGSFQDQDADLGQHVRIENSIFLALAPREYLVEWIPQQSPRFAYNCLYSMSELRSGFTGPNLEADSTNLFLDPLLVSTNPLDPHLTEGSPCIDAGDPDSPLDPDSTRADIGKYYYHHENYTPQVLQTPKNHLLLQSYPNPFNRATTISYSVPNPSNLSLVIYNILGNPVATVFNGYSTAGQHALSWQAVDLPSGVYVCRLEAGDVSRQVRLVNIR